MQASKAGWTCVCAIYQHPKEGGVSSDTTEKIKSYTFLCHPDIMSGTHNPLV